MVPVQYLKFETIDEFQENHRSGAPRHNNTHVKDNNDAVTCCFCWLKRWFGKMMTKHYEKANFQPDVYFPYIGWEQQRYLL